MSALKPTSTKIKLGNQEYGLRFTINAIDDIQDKFDRPIDELGEIISKDTRNAFKNIKTILTILINEDIDYQNDSREVKLPHVDERYIGRYITPSDIEQLTSAIFNSFTSSAPETDDDDPNSTSEQRND